MSKYIRIIFTTLLGILFWHLAAPQTTCYETVVLPPDSRFGGSDVQGSPLIGSTYGAGQGPGIYIVADGGYRLYLNGELLAYDNAAGRVRFIPMTFLPGKNALSVVGINGAGAPGVMVHVDELHQSFVSNASWKFNASPTDNTWKNKTFNDAGWGAATVQSSGNILQTPGGLAITGFPSNSSARWIWSSSVSATSGVFRFSFDLKPQGFGESTTGGDGGPVVVIKTMAEFLTRIQTAGKEILLIPEGTWDVREYSDQKVCHVECNSTLPTYKGDFNDLAGTCPTSYRTVQKWAKLIWVKGNKSIIGMGRGASIRGAQFYANDGVQANIIFRNLKVWDVNPHIIEAGDAISMNGVKKLWVDHCTFKWISDGNDVDHGTEQTWSWNIVQGDNEFMCSKRDHYAAALDYSDITYDHVYWENCEGRDPKCSQYDRVHMINNYHNVNKYYAAGSAKYSQVLVEGTVFESISQPLITENTGLIHERNNQFINCGPFKRDNVNVSSLKDAVFTPPYSYTLESLSTVAASVKNGAGAGGRWHTMPLYTDAASLSNTAPVVSITSPLNGASFSNPTSMTLTASASDPGGSIAKVEFYSGTVKLGEDASAPYTFMLTSFTTCTYSFVAVATDNNGKKTMSWPVTIHVTKNVKPIKYIYSYDNSGNYAWENTNSWTPKAVPSDIDTVIVRTGEVRIANLNHSGPVYVEANGILRLIDTAAVNDLRLQGGTLKAYTSSPGFVLMSNIRVEAPSTIMAGSVSATIFTLNGSITGSSDLIKTSVGNLRINSNASTFKGNWIVSEGKLQLRSANGLGLCGVKVNAGAVLDIEAASTIYSLVIDSTGRVDLDQSLSSDVLVLGKENVEAGSYTNANRPSYIGSVNTLTVKNSILKASGATSLCAGNSVQLQTLSSSGYSWKNTAIQVGTTQTYTANSSGDYSITVSNANGCKVTSATLPVRVSSLPSAVITNGNSTTFCEGGSVVLTASAGSTYKWFKGTTQVGSDQNYSATTSGDYVVEVTNAEGCKATSAKTVVTVNSSPAATITAASSTTLCEGESVALTASAGSSYKWFNGTTQLGIDQTFIATTAGNYTVEVTNANGCIAISPATAVTENTSATGTITALGPTTLCQGESVVLSFSSGSSYKWFKETTQVGTGETYIANTSGNYSVEVTNANGCKVNSAPITVLVNSLPIATISFNGSTAICEGESVDLTASAGSSYRWFKETIEVGTSQKYTGTTPGDYNVEVTNANGCKASSTKTTLVVNSLPTAEITSDGATTFCAGESVTLVSSPGNSYQWFKGITQAGSNQTYIATSSGEYKVEVTDSKGCKKLSQGLVVTESQVSVPVITAGGTTDLCEGESVVLSTGIENEYIWYKDATAVGNSETYSAAEAGAYKVEVINPDGCKAISEAVVVEVSPCTPTSLSTSKRKASAKAFPNPFENEIRIEHKGEFRYQLYDSKGILLEEGNASDHALIGKELRAGIYLMKIENVGETETIVIVKY